MVVTIDGSRYFDGGLLRVEGFGSGGKLFFVLGLGFGRGK